MKPTSIQNGGQINEQKRMRWKMMHKSFNILQNSTPNQPKWCPGALPKATSQASRRNVGHIFETNVTIFEKWSILAAILWFSWAPGGSQNPFFWYQVFPKSYKMSSRMRYQSKYDFLIELFALRESRRPLRWPVYTCVLSCLTMFTYILNWSHVS